MNDLFNRLMFAQNQPMPPAQQQQRALQALGPQLRPQQPPLAAPAMGQGPLTRGVPTGLPPQAQGLGLGGVPAMGMPPQSQGLGQGGVPVNGMPLQAQGGGPVNPGPQIGAGPALRAPNQFR